MTRAAGIKWALSVLVAATTLQAAPAAACGLHGGMVDLAAAHPQSIAVALAVRDALDSAALRSLPTLPPALGLMRASWLLRGFSPQLVDLSRATRGTVAVLLVESGLWARFAVDGMGATGEVHVSGPLPDEPVVVTSEAVLSALADGTLTVQSAAALGVAVVGAAGGA